MKVPSAQFVLGLISIAALAACSSGEPIDAYLPQLPPTGGAPIAKTGRLTELNFDAERVPGPASQGLVGDYFLKNDKIRVVVQAPGRAIGPCPFGGNIIDADVVESPTGDEFGEMSAFLQLGRTFNFTEVEVVRDGAAGGPAVLRMRGHDTKNDFIDVVGLGSFALAIGEDYLPDVDLKLRAAVTYILEPGATSVRVIYTMYNTATSDTPTLWGTLNDTGAHVEIFHPRGGYGELSFSDIIGDSAFPLVSYVAFQGRQRTYGIVPIFEDKTLRGATIPVAGVDVEAYALKDKFDAFGPSGQSLVLTAQKGTTRELLFMVGRDVADISAQSGAARSDNGTSVSGRVTGPGAAGARVTAVEANSTTPALALETTFTAAADGSFSGVLPPGLFKVQAEGEGYRRSAVLDVDAGQAGLLTLELPAQAELSYTIRDRAGAAIPGKVSVLGALPNVPDRRFRDTVKDELPHGIVGWRASVEGDSSKRTAHDHPIVLAPGRYRVVVSRGPEWSLFEQVVDLGEAGARVDAVLDHVLPTPGYFTTDFHQHSYMSPDAPASPEERVATFLAEGIDFIVSSDHDFHFDYAPIIKSLGAERLLSSAVGVETTPWAYGHFIGFPMAVDPLAPNGGAFDWAGGESIANLAPAEIFSGMRALGAKVIEVNHPRSSPGAFSSFQQNFDRGGLTFDFASRSFFGARSAMPLSPVQLGLPEDAEVFSNKFDVLEVYNGFHLAEPVDGERGDVQVDLNLRDWMNFLSFGFTPTAVGNSDSHTWISAPAGVPHSWVRVPDDSEGALTQGPVDDIISTVLGQTPKDIIVSNGPFLQLSVDGKGIGSTVAHGAGGLAIHLEVKSAAWAPVDTIEVFANNTFTIPVPKNQLPDVMTPILCFTTRPMPTARCAAAIGGARAMTVSTVETVPGQPSSARYEISIDATDIDGAMIAARTRTGSNGSPDAWLFARAFGDVGLYPVIPTDVATSVSISDLVETRQAVLGAQGVPALAFTNPIFIDFDGNGYKAPFAN